MADEEDAEHAGVDGDDNLDHLELTSGGFMA